MFIINSYALAVVFCFITMLCWGSWGNTQKLAGKTWRYELFYWDYVTMFFVRHGDAKPAAKETVLDGIGGAD